MSLSVPRGRGKNVGHHFAGHHQVFLEHRQLPHRHILAVGHEALIFREPVEPLRAFAVSGLNGPMPVRHGVGRIADVARLRLASSPRSSPASHRPPDEAGHFGLLRRKMRIALPRVRAGLEAGRVLEVEARLILQIMREELRLDLLAKLLADRLRRTPRAQAARRRRPVAVTPRAQHQEVLMLVVVRLERRVLDLRARTCLPGRSSRPPSAWARSPTSRSCSTARDDHTLS